MKIVFILVLLTIVILPLSLIYLKYRHDLPPEKKFSFFSNIFMTVLVLVISNVISLFLLEKKPPDYFAINRPYIEPKLMLKVDGSNSYKFSFILENIGKLPADNLRYLCMSPASKGSEIKKMTSLELAPGAEMSLMVLPRIFDLSFEEDEMFLTFRLIIFYTASVYDEKKDFRSDFKFIISKDEIEEKEFNYVSASREEGELDQQEIFKMLDVKNVLDDKTGTFTAVFNEYDQKFTTPQCLSGTLDKKIIYSPKERTMMLIIRIKEDQGITLSHILKKKSDGRHVIIYSWDETGGSFYVDGEPKNYRLK